MNHTLSAIVFGISVLCLCNPATLAGDDAHEKLLPLQFIVGQWKTAEYDSPAEIPEINAKKGSKSVQQLSTMWILGGNAIELTIQTSVDGKMLKPSKEIVAWDPKKKEISHVIVDGNGFLGDGSWRKEKDAWHLDWKCVTDQGTYSGTSIHRKLTSDQFQWQMVNVTRDGKKLPDWPVVDHFRVEDPHHQWLSYLKGEWNVEFDNGEKGDVEFVSVGNTPALTFTSKVGDFSIAGIIGWHEEQKEFIETDFLTDDGGNGYLRRRFSKVTPDALVGSQTWWNETDGRGSQELVYQRISKGEFKLIGKASDSGGESWTVHFRRKTQN